MHQHERGTSLCYISLFFGCWWSSWATNQHERGGQVVNDVNRRVAEKESELRLLRLTGIRTRERLNKVLDCDQSLYPLSTSSDQFWPFWPILQISFWRFYRGVVDRGWVLRRQDEKNSLLRTKWAFQSRIYIFSSLWLFSPSLPPLASGSLWLSCRTNIYPKKKRLMVVEMQKVK